MKRLCLGAAAAILSSVFIAGCSPVPTPTTNAPIVDAPRVALKWTEDFDQALALAKTEKKLVLMNFTGSTWCPPCMALDRNVFKTAAFEEYAAKNFVLVKLDVPNPTTLPPNVEALGNKYLGGEFRFPTIVIASADGQRLGATGYSGTGPEPFIAELEKIAKK